MMRTETPSPILVAPRPVRVAPGGGAFPTSFLARQTQHVRLVSAPATVAEEDGLAVEEMVSSRSSPRSPLPSEALEEFLSILKPSLPGFFPPKSPVTMRGLRQQVSLPAIMFNERAASRNSDPNTNAKTPESDGPEADFQVLDLDDATSPSFRWFTSSVLSSPISRSNTRNPFQRHASPLYHRQTPSNAHMYSLSPAAVPLPLPTPDGL